MGMYTPTVKKEVSEDAKMLIEEKGKIYRTEIPKKVEMVQADWDEEDETSPAYIRNKKNLPVTCFTVDFDHKHKVPYETPISEVINTQTGESVTDINEIIDAFYKGVVRIYVKSGSYMVAWGTMVGLYYGDYVSNGPSGTNGIRLGVVQTDNDTSYTTIETYCYHYTPVAENTSTNTSTY